MRVRCPGLPTGVCLAAALLVAAAPVGAQGAGPLALPSQSIECAARGADESLLWPLAAELQGREAAELSFVVRVDGTEIFRESYTVAVPAEGGPYALPVFLGGVTEARALQKRRRPLARKTAIELLVNGEVAVNLGLDQFVALDRESRRDNLELARIVEFRSTMPDSANLLGGTSEGGEEALALPTKALRVCPGVDPNVCDAYFDLCIDDCQGSCWQTCNAQWESCMYGTFWTHTERTLTRLTPSFQPVCGFYPWYNFWRPKLWEEYAAVWRNREIETQVCHQGQRYDTVLRQWTSSEFCYVKTRRSCGPSATNMSGLCRL